MHMIFDSIYDNGFTICFIDQVTDNTQKLWSPFFINDGVPVFYCEYSLQIDLVVGVSHVFYFLCSEPSLRLSFHTVPASLPRTEVHGYKIKPRLRLWRFKVYHGFIRCRAVGSDLFCKAGFKSGSKSCIHQSAIGTTYQSLW